MGIVECTMFWLLVCYVPKGSSSSISVGGYQAKIQRQCSFTRYPDLCLTTLSEYQNQNVDTSLALVNKAVYESTLPISRPFTHVNPQFYAREDKLAKSLAEYCHELNNMSLKRLRQSQQALIKESQKKNDIQTWLSAAITFQQACKDSYEEGFNPFSDHMEYLSRLVSNTLAIVNLGNETSSSQHQDEIHGFPIWVSSKGRKLLQVATIKANVVVSKDGTGDYKTVAEAIQVATGNRFVIYIKKGVYKEKIKTDRNGITLIGDGKFSTIIVNGASVAGGASMPGSATFTITGDGFIARDIGFQNTAGPQGEQALALYVASDHSVFYRCSIVGYQDTLYALALRQFYKECDIYGTLDFIFGNAAAVFQNCNIMLRQPRRGGSNAILASGRTDPGQNTGFCLQKCSIAASPESGGVKNSYSSYLGRPWKEYSRAIVMQSSMDDSISSRGWLQWPGTGSGSLKNLYFAEYSNTGAGSATSGRVNWPGHHVIGAQEAIKFTVRNFIAGNSWIPSTGIAFISDL